MICIAEWFVNACYLAGLSEENLVAIAVRSERDPMSPLINFWVLPFQRRWNMIEDELLARLAFPTSLDV